MAFQYLTVSMSENSKANNGFIDQKQFKTNLRYTFDSLVLKASFTDQSMFDQSIHLK